VDVTEIAERWRPFRSYAALYLWEFGDNKPKV
jgi:3-methyladenine DNA glycosylase/8-oxoguanine DNA glycosylase